MQLNDSNNKTLENFSFSNFNCAHFERMTDVRTIEEICVNCIAVKAKFTPTAL